MTKQQLVDEYARKHLCATCEWKNGDICAAALHEIGRKESQ